MCLIKTCINNRPLKVVLRETFKIRPKFELNRVTNTTLVCKRDLTEELASNFKFQFENLT